MGSPLGIRAVEGLHGKWRSALFLYQDERAVISTNRSKRKKMKKNECNWKVGEVVNLPRTETLLKTRGMISYERLIGSRYICIREATDNQRGILVKVLGRCLPQSVAVVGGQPFTKDDFEESFEGTHYFSYPYPATKDVREMLDILNSNPTLLQYFENASMHVNPKAKFWVRDMGRQMLVFKQPQCYDAVSDILCTIRDDESAYRLTMVYFFKDELIY